MTGTAGQKRLAKDFFSFYPLPIPPLAEQHRIVAKVDELMALCDQLEQCSESQSDSADADELAKSWARLSTHFDTIFTTEASIDALKQTILQLAVMGKLTADKNTTTHQENNKVVARHESLKYEGLHNEIPNNWSVKNLSEIAANIIDCPHSTPTWTEHGFICVRTNQFQVGHLDLSASRYVSQATYLDRIQRLKPSFNDILYSREGGILGVACRIPKGVDICLGQRMMLIRMRNGTLPEYTEIVLNSPLITSIARRMTTGGAAPRVNVSSVKNYPIPHPPLEEQVRIVAKTNELIGICGQLKSRLQTSQQTQLALAESLVAGALS